MASHKVVTTNAEIDKAVSQAAALAMEPRVLAIDYLPAAEHDLFLLRLTNGERIAIPRENLEGLNSATPEQSAKVEILGSGTGLHWPELNFDLYVPNLLLQITGTKRWMSQIGRRGGSAQSQAKRAASQSNGRKGGRPRLVAASQEWIHSGIPVEESRAAIAPYE